MKPRPNVLIFCVDEMRADHMGCAGNLIVKTPHIDGIAAGGTLFRNARCNNPICMPARATMFTGLLPRDHGLRVNGQSLRKDVPTLAQVLSDSGYRTHAAGKLHLTPWVPKVDPPEPEKYPECLAYWNNGDIETFPVPYYGFQSVDFVGGHTSYAYGPYVKWLEAHGGNRDMLTEACAPEPPSGAPNTYKMGIPEELHYNRYIADSTIRAVRSAREEGQPFFAWCSFPDPHAPIAAPVPYCDMYDPAEIPLPPMRDGEVSDLPPVYRKVLSGELRPNGTDNRGVEARHWQEMIAQTYGMITHLDAEIGRVLQAVTDIGAGDDTVVVFISDHGDMMGDHGLLWKGFYTFRGCSNIPAVIAAPGMKAGQASEALFSQLDLMPTMLDLCGLEMPGSDWSERETPFDRGAEIPLRTYPGLSARGVLDGSDERLRDSVVIENDDPTTGLQVRALVTDRYRLAVYPGTHHGELFDLVEDPDELFNLWYKPEHAAMRLQLIEQLLSDYATDTPLYPVPPWNS